MSLPPAPCVAECNEVRNTGTDAAQNGVEDLVLEGLSSPVPCVGSAMKSGTRDWTLQYVWDLEENNECVTSQGSWHILDTYTL